MFLYNGCSGTQWAASSLTFTRISCSSFMLEAVGYTDQQNADNDTRKEQYKPDTIIQLPKLDILPHYSSFPCKDVDQGCDI